MKACTGCGTGLEATAENFSPNKKTKDGLQSKCRSCHRGVCKRYRESNREILRVRAKNRYESHHDIVQGQVAKYHATVKGYVRQLHSSMVQRCKNQKSYASVECKFTSDELLDYVTNVMEVDPRGKDIHRIDNDGNYEPGNIEFLAEDEHVARHKELRCM